MRLFGGGNRTRAKKGQLDFRHVAAASALAQGKSAKVAAEAAGVSERQIENWKNEEAFVELKDSFVETLVAQARLKMPESTILDKANRLASMQEVHDRAMRRMSDPKLDLDEFVALGKLRIDVLDKASKDLGQHGQPLNPEGEKGLPFVLNLQHSGVIDTEVADAS